MGLPNDLACRLQFPAQHQPVALRDKGESGIVVAPDRPETS